MVVPYAERLAELIPPVSTRLRRDFTPSIRATVEAVKQLLPKSRMGVSLSQLAEALGIDKSTTSRRVKAAQKDHYLIDDEDQKGRPTRLVLGEPLPENVQILPSPPSLGQGTLPLM